MKKLLIIFALAFVSLNFISAVPEIPHQFYGSVTVNGVPAPDNNIIRASVENDIYLTVTKNGFYGLSPNIFYIEDPKGDREENERTIFFYVDRTPAGSMTFVNNGYTRLDFDLNTTCGDNSCIGTETCGNCQTDCGICTNPPVITITSPEAKTYDTTNVIDLTATSDQPLRIWMYALDGENFVTFTPNITLTLANGNYNLVVLGINQVFQTGTSSVAFNVNVPYCGNGVCNAEESCSSCSVDCGACSSSSSSSGGGGGGSSSSSSGGGGGGIVKPQNTTANTGIVNLGIEENTDTDSGQLAETETQTTEENKGFFSGITGAVAGLGENLGSLKSLIVIVFVVGIVAAFIAVSVSRRKNRYVSKF